PAQRPGRVRAPADRPRRLLRGPQPDRPDLRGRSGGRRRQPPLLLPRRRPVVLRRHLMEVQVIAMNTRGVAAAALALALLAGPAHGADLTLGQRLEYTHVQRGHEFHVSGAAVGAGPDGRPVLAWAAEENHVNQLYVLAPGDGAEPVRVNPDGLAVDALHLPPRLATGPGGGPLYVSWSSEKPKLEGVLFASDLRLSRSLDGLAVGRDGTVLVTWIDGREGRPDPATWVARVVEQGTRVEGIRKVGDGT